MAYESIFMPLHCQRTGTAAGFFVQDLQPNKYIHEFVSIEEEEKPEPEPDDGGHEKKKKLSLDFLPSPVVKIEGSTNQGILCCVMSQKGFRYPRFCVCKPTTKQWQPLPNPKMRYFTIIAVGMVVLSSHPSLRYKIVRLSDPKPWVPNKYRCEIYDSDTSAWRELKDDILLPPTVDGGTGFILPNELAVAAGGTILHWLTSNDGVLAFDTETETYAVFGLPQPVVVSEQKGFPHTNKHLVDYKGRLGFVCRAPNDPENLQQWVMADYKNRVWRKKEKMMQRVDRSTGSFRAFFNAGVALIIDVGSVLFYNFQNRSFNKVKLHCYTQPYNVYAFRSDSEPVNFRGLVRKC